jgi:hypothetical protein
MVLDGRIQNIEYACCLKAVKHRKQRPRIFKVARLVLRRKTQVEDDATFIGACLPLWYEIF